MTPNLLSLVNAHGEHAQAKDKHDKRDASGFEAALAHAQHGVQQVPPHAGRPQPLHPLKKPAQAQQGRDGAAAQAGQGTSEAAIARATQASQSAPVTHAELSESLAQKLEALQQGT
ncbi:MAG: hypothetical protein JST92_10835, partial [Deltaproteobacteria bacterium]|nr:hypothetical protein [Deltaproteobacteria bacterium]